MTSYPAGSDERRFCEWVLMNPGITEPSLLAFVASDPAVVNSITLEGDVADTSKVKDSDINRVVAARWTIVAKKFPARTNGNG